MTTRRSTKTTTHRAERKCSSSSSSSAFCDACVYIIKSLTEVLFNNNREIQLLNKYLSSFSLVRCVLSRGQRSKNLKPEIAQIYIRSLSFASKSDWFFQLIRHFSSASNLNQNILLLCISYITEEISDDRGGVRKWARDTWTATPIVAREKVDERKQRCWTRDDWCTSNRGIANFGGEFIFSN